MSDTLRPETRMAAAITLRISASGNAELDAMIAQGERQEIAVRIMMASVSNPNQHGQWQEFAEGAVAAADALLAALRTKEAPK